MSIRNSCIKVMAFSHFVFVIISVGMIQYVHNRKFSWRFRMRTKIAVIIFSILAVFMMAGCGGDPLVGDWMYKGKSAWYGSDVLYVFHIEKLDNGNYTITPAHRVYEQAYASELAPSRNDMYGKDALMNTKEVFVPGRKLFGTTFYKWNGTPVKMGRKYVLNVLKGNVINNAKKEDIPMKDGKLVLKVDSQTVTYEKVDKEKINKAMSDWRESLKKDLGKEVVFRFGFVEAKEIKGVISKVIIEENGKKEVLEVK